ncbi:MAG: 30S ribosomal protein S15 [Patescibacteria group bacterium]|mgnify:FL=1
MPISKEKIRKIILNYGKNEKNTGSPEVQIALLTEEILNLLEHLKNHKKDKSSKRGLILKLAHRKKLLRYLRKVSYERYKKITEELGL